MSVGRGHADPARCADDVRFAQLYDRCYQPIRDCRSRRVPLDSVDDAVADTFLTAWRRIDDIPAGGAALVWMYGVAYRVIGHQRRSTARRGRLQNRLRTAGVRPVAAADDAVVDGVQLRLVVAALARLGDTDAEVLRLVAWEQLSVAGVAAVLGIEPDAARQRLHRARRHLALVYDRLQSRPASTPAAPKGGAQ